MEACTKAKCLLTNNLAQKKDVVMVFKNGLTEQFTKDTGLRIRLKAKELFGMQKVIFTLESLLQIKLAVLESTLTLMAVAMKVSGLMMFNKVKVKRLGLMELSMLVSTRME